MKKWLILVIAPMFFLVDFFLKKFVIAHSSELLSGLMTVHVKLLPFVSFDLAYIENTGMAWGMFASFQTWILVLRVLVIGIICAGLLKSKSMQRLKFPFMLILFGAFANVLDTFMYGHVIDMLHFQFWGRSYGVFNVADAMIFIGAILILFSREGAHAIKE